MWCKSSLTVVMSHKSCWSCCSGKEKYKSLFHQMFSVEQLLCNFLYATKNFFNGSGLTFLCSERFLIAPIQPFHYYYIMQCVFQRPFDGVEEILAIRLPYRTQSSFLPYQKRVPLPSKGKNTIGTSLHYVWLSSCPHTLV